jgi:hypothetical protein
MRPRRSRSAVRDSLEPRDVLLQRLDSAEQAGVALLGALADLLAQGRIALLVVALHLGLVPAGDVVGADQLLDEGRRDVERDGDDGDAHDDAEVPARHRAGPSSSMARRRRRAATAART